MANGAYYEQCSALTSKSARHSEKSSYFNVRNLSNDSLNFFLPKSQITLQIGVIILRQKMISGQYFTGVNILQIITGTNRTWLAYVHTLFYISLKFSRSSYGQF